MVNSSLNLAISQIKEEYARGGRSFQKIKGKKADLKGLNLSNIDLTGADLSYADLRGVDLSGSRLKECCLTGANLHGSNLTRVNLEKAILEETNLNEANLAKANLRQAYLKGCHLTKANLQWSNLSEAELSSAHLNQANLSNANLTNGSLMGSFLTGANLSNASLSGAMLNGAWMNGVDFRGTNLQQAEYTDQTHFDLGFDPDAAGMILVDSVTVEKLLTIFNHISQCSNHYLGRNITTKYWQSTRPGNYDWLSNFKIDDFGVISFSGVIKEPANRIQLQWTQRWIEEFINSCSEIIQDFSNLIDKNIYCFRTNINDGN